MPLRGVHAMRGVHPMRGVHARLSFARARKAMSARWAYTHDCMGMLEISNELDHGRSQHPRSGPTDRTGACQPADDWLAPVTSSVQDPHAIEGLPCDHCNQGTRTPGCDFDPPRCDAWICSRGSPPCPFGMNHACVRDEVDRCEQQAGNERPDFRERVPLAFAGGFCMAAHHAFCLLRELRQHPRVMAQARNRSPIEHPTDRLKVATIASAKCTIWFK